MNRSREFSLLRISCIFLMISLESAVLLQRILSICLIVSDTNFSAHLLQACHTPTFLDDLAKTLLIDIPFFGMDGKQMYHDKTCCYRQVIIIHNLIVDTGKAVCFFCPCNCHIGLKCHVVHVFLRILQKILEISGKC